MSEAEAIVFVKRDAEATTAPTLSDDEIKDALRAWLYVSGSFDTSSTQADARYMRSVALAWGKKAGKQTNPLADIDVQLPPEGKTEFDNLRAMQRDWNARADEAERLATIAAAAQVDSISSARTRTVRIAPVF